MAVRLHDKYALITGAGRGLGLEMAIAMGEAGLAGITITAAPGSDETSTQINNELQEAVSIIEKTGTKVNAMVSDVGRSDDCKNAVDSHMKSFPSLDILINNAGKAGRYAHLGDTDNDISSHDPAGVSEIIATNLCGPYFMLHHALPYMRRLTKAPYYQCLQADRVNAPEGLDPLRPHKGRARGGHDRVGRILGRDGESP